MTEIETYIEQIKEAEVWCGKSGDDHISYSGAQIKQLIEAGHIPNELGKWFFENLENQRKQHLAFKELTTKNPHLTQEEIMEFFYPHPFSQEETVCIHRDMANNLMLLRILFMNKELLKPGALDDLPQKFFKGLEANEFGIARLVADPINRMPELLKNSSSSELVTDNVYLIKWECNNSIGDKIRLEYRFRADSKEESDKRVDEFVKRITGRQKKVYEACWMMSNKKSQRIFSCELTELMEMAYPARKAGSYFSTKEKVTFYQDLLDLSETKLIVSKKQTKNQNNRNKEKIDSFILPFVTIHKTTGRIGGKESEKYPNRVSLSVLYNPLYKDEKMYNLGAGIKNTTLELEADEIQLAEWIQIRKSQSMTNPNIKFDRAFLIDLCKLNGTDKKNPTMANKRLLIKLERLKEKGIILGYPKQIKEIVSIKAR